MICATCHRPVPDGADACGGCGTPTAWVASDSSETKPDIAARYSSQTSWPEGEATAASSAPPADLPTAAAVEPPAPVPTSVPVERPAAAPAPRVATTAAGPRRSLLGPIIVAAVVVVAIAIAAMIVLRRAAKPLPAPERAGAGAPAETQPAPPTPTPVEPTPVKPTPPAPTPPAPLGDVWLGLVDRSAGHALVLEPLMHHVSGAWRHDWLKPVEDDGAQSATSLVLRVRNEWLSRPDALPAEWHAWDAAGASRLVTVSNPTTVALGCMRAAGFKTDLPFPKDAAAFRQADDGEIVLTDPLVIVSGPAPSIPADGVTPESKLARSIPAATVTPESKLASLAWPPIDVLNRLEAAGVERWAAESGTEDGRVKGTGIALDAATRAASGAWKLTGQAASAPVAGATPVFFTATRTHPYTAPGRAVECESIVAVSGWVLVRGDAVERLDKSVRVEHGDCDKGPPTARVLAFLEDDDHRLAVELELGYESVDVVLVDIGAEGARRVLVVSHGGC